MTSIDDVRYRPCVGIAILNAAGHVFTGQRYDSTVEAWQMPQGGIDEGESSEQAAYRELCEETGLLPQHVRLKAVKEEWLYYDLPDHLQGKLWGGKYIGQKQQWVAFDFIGKDADINIETAQPEFKAWQWLHPHDLESVIVPFKRDLYREVVRWLAACGS